MAAICVFCASSVGIGQRYLELSRELGECLAVAGHSLVSGGGRVSMMGEVARAARAAGASTVGVIPKALLPREVPDDEADELIVVDTMRERKRVMDERSDAVIALPGGLGTLEELFEMWTSSYLGMHAKPVIVIDPDGFFKPLWEFLDGLRERGFVRQYALDALRPVTSVAEALELVAAPR